MCHIAGISTDISEQRSRGVLIKRCSEDMQQIYRRTPMPKCDFTLEITLRHGCSPVNLLHIFRISFPKNTSGGLLLIFASPATLRTFSAIKHRTVLSCNVFSNSLYPNWAARYREWIYICLFLKGKLARKFAFVLKLLWYSLLKENVSLITVCRWTKIRGKTFHGKIFKETETSILVFKSQLIGMKYFQFILPLVFMN